MIELRKFRDLTAAEIAKIHRLNKANCDKCILKKYCMFEKFCYDAKIRYQIARRCLFELAEETIPFDTELYSADEAAYENEPYSIRFPEL